MALTLAVGRCTAHDVGRTIDALMRSPIIVELKQDGLLTTRSIVTQEREIVQIAARRKGEAQAGFSAGALRAALSDKRFSEEQRDAIEHALSAASVVTIEGGPGVGKTTTATALAAACRLDQRRLIIAAPSWTATETVQTELQHDGPALAVDKLLHDIQNNKFELQPGDVVLVDEAAMLGTMQILELQRVTQQAGAKLILQGDPQQIASVGRGDPFSLIARATGSQQIRTIRRQTVEWQRQASMTAQNGQIGQALTAYHRHDSIEFSDEQEALIEAMAKAFKEANGNAVALAATNQQVEKINNALRAAAQQIGLVGGPEVIVRATPRGAKARPRAADLPLAMGDRLILGGEVTIDGVTLRNASRLVVKKVVPEGEKIVFETSDGRRLTTTVAQLERAGRGGKQVVLQHAYAVTIHAAQGATWPMTLWMPSHEDRRSALVAMTRHRSDLKIFVDRSALPNLHDGHMMIGPDGLDDPEKPCDDRSDVQIVAAIGKSMERTSRPRNALDVLGLEEGTSQPVLVRGGMGTPSSAVDEWLLDEPVPDEMRREENRAGTAPEHLTADDELALALEENIPAPQP